MPAVISSASASTQANAGNAPSFAIDNDDNTKWTASTNTGWIRLNLSAAYVVTDYRITPSPAQLTFAPKTWTFEGTNDGTFATWTTLDTITNFTSFVNGASKTFTFANSTAYLYYRLNVSAANGGASLALSELRLTAAPTIGLLGGNGGTMVHWWAADTITGRSNGDTVAFGDMVDLAGAHNFTTAVGTSLYRPTGGPNSLPAVEHAVTGSGFYRSTTSQQATGDTTLFVVGYLGGTTNQQLISSGTGCADLDVNSSKFRMLRHGQATLATSTTNHPTSTWFILIVTYVSSTGSTKFRIITSGSDVTDTISGTTSTFGSAQSNQGWGLFTTTTSAANQGKNAEMGQYASVLGTADLQALYDYLYSKYFVSKLPVPQLRQNPAASIRATI